MPFPRRPQFQISDINLNGLLAYVATNSIIFIEIENESPSFRDSPSEDMHKDEVTAISFCREKGYYHLLATASRDKTVKIWDTTDISKGKLLCKQTLCWKAEIVSIDWQLKKNKDTLYVLDNKGVLIVWRLENDSHFIVNTVVSSRAILLSASPYNRFLVALGYQGGLIHIFHSMRHGIGKILEGHVEDIISLSWPPHFPSSDNVTKDWSDTLDIASTSKDGTIRVWNIETQRCLVLEKPPSCKVSNSKDDYIIACWNPRSLREIFCSSSN